MKIIILIIIGTAGGLIGGMGMGGGTLLIPLLVIFTNINQHAAQFINLAAFIPMSVIAIIIHLKNKLVDVKKAVIIAVPATIISVASSLLADKISADNLRMYFGIFLLVLGVYQLGDLIYQQIKKHRAKKVE